MLASRVDESLALLVPQPHAGASADGRIGPNAITRLSEALEALHGRQTCHSIFAAAGAAQHLAVTPTHMVDEMDVAHLHRALREALGPDGAEAVSRRAGALTARYLLDNRIPRFAQAMLRLLPARPALRLLCAAIGRHAWTFVGSGSFSVSNGATVKLIVRNSPIAREITAPTPVCSYYSATFEGVIAGALGQRVTVRETDCEATGSSACIFEVILGK